MSIQFYLDIEGKRYMLPVSPGKIEMKRASNNSIIEIAKLGDVNVGGGHALISTSFSSIFPADYQQSWVEKGAKPETARIWIDRLTNAKADNDRVRLIVTDTRINVVMLIESFDWGYEDTTGDVHYNLSLTEYKEILPKYKKTVAKKVSPVPRPAPTKKPITIGCEVIVNGRLYRDSYGNGPGLTEKNARRKVNFIQKGRKYPYHVCLVNGSGVASWRGWVAEGSVKRV